METTNNHEETAVLYQQDLFWQFVKREVTKPEIAKGIEPIQIPSEFNEPVTENITNNPKFEHLPLIGDPLEADSSSYRKNLDKQDISSKSRETNSNMMSYENLGMVYDNSSMWATIEFNDSNNLIFVKHFPESIDHNGQIRFSETGGEKGKLFSHKAKLKPFSDRKKDPLRNQLVAYVLSFVMKQYKRLILTEYYRRLDTAGLESDGSLKRSNKMPADDLRELIDLLGEKNKLPIWDSEKETLKPDHVYRKVSFERKSSGITFGSNTFKIYSHLYRTFIFTP